jgi:hypothetical protein
MSLNYLFNILSSLLYALVVGRYLYGTYSWSFTSVEVVLNIVTLVFSLSCTFVDPGIVTLKTHLVAELEDDPEMSECCVESGGDFYMWVNKETILFNLQAREAAKGIALQILRQLREGLRPVN